MQSLLLYFCIKIVLIRMKAQDQENNVFHSFSVLDWMSFIPGKGSVNDITVTKFNGDIGSYVPDHFFSPTYCIEIVTKGLIAVSINNKEYEITPNGGYAITPDFLLRRPTSSHQAEIYTLAFSRMFASELHLSFPLSQIAQFYVRPIWQMSDKKTQNVLHYFELLKNVIDENNRTAAIDLTRSLIHYLVADLEPGLNTQSSLSHIEEITGRFLALVDEHCERQHSLDWYASELCLSTRYVANTVKKVLGMTASSCLERAIVQRAQILLSTTAMPIQTISDQLGFQNQSHFGTFFKRQIGLSPKMFRMNVSGNSNKEE